MTYASDLGLKVGSKIKYLGCGELSHRHGTFNIGDILTLKEDDGSECPLFVNKNGTVAYFSLRREWEHYKEENTMIERDGKYNLEVTGEQLAFIALLAGRSNGCWASLINLYNNTSNLFFNDNIPHRAGRSIDLQREERQINTWLDALFTKPESLKEKQLRELKEQHAAILKQQEELGKKIEELSNDND